MPVHSPATVGDPIIDVQALWLVVKTTLQELVIDKTPISTADLIKRMGKRTRESELEFLWKSKDDIGDYIVGCR